MSSINKADAIAEIEILVSSLDGKATPPWWPKCEGIIDRAWAAEDYELVAKACRRGIELAEELNGSTVSRQHVPDDVETRDKIG